MKVAKNTDSIALYADAEHLNTDIYSSLTVFLGLVCIHYTGIHAIDPILAVIVAVIIIHTGYKICKEAVNNLLDGSLPEKNIKEIKSIIEKYNEHGICGIKEIKTRKAGKNKEINITLLLEGERTIKYAHDLCDALEKDIEQNLGNTEVTIPRTQVFWMFARISICKNNNPVRIKSIPAYRVYVPSYFI